MDVTISIIIPVFNNERSIRRCLDSIVNQDTHFAYEVILVCDPCKDKTLDIIKEYEKRYSFIYHIDVTTRSIALARKKGIESSKGRYLMFIDADDYYTYDAITTMLQAISRNDADIAVGNYYYVKKGKNKKNLLSKNITYDKAGMLKALMQDTYMHGFMWNKIYKASLLKDSDYVYPKGNIIREDVLTNFQVFLKANKLVQFKKPVYYYDKTFESTTSMKDKTRIPWFINIFAAERHLIEKYQPELLNMYLSFHLRRKLLIFGDEIIMKSSYAFKDFIRLIREDKKHLKVLKQKGNLKTEGMPWESFIKSFK